MFSNLRFSIPVLTLLFWPLQGEAGDSKEGKALLERNCSRCHAISAETKSPLAIAPNLWLVLQSYSSEQLEFELSEGMGSQHREMPQIQFTSEEIASIQSYLSDE